MPSQDIPHALLTEYTALSLDKPQIDIELGLKYCANYWSIYLEALALYVNKMDTLLAEMQQGMTTGSYDQVRIVAHSLRSMSGNIGATQVQTRAKELETAIIANQSTQLATLHNALVDAITQALFDINQIVTLNSSA